MPEDKKKASSKQPITSPLEKEPPEDYTPFFDFDPIGFAFDAMADLVTGKIFEGPKKVVEEITPDASVTKPAEQPERQAPPVTINNIFRSPAKSKRKPDGAGGVAPPKEKGAPVREQEQPEGDEE